jgi:class 3 adenylate cyclase/tetratricopeptide (TPR) repeat protein
MRSSKCGSENRATAKFCDGCGTELPLICSACGASNRVVAKFCDSCGSALGTQASPSAAATASPQVAGERRHLTILFCDLVGSVTHTSQLDPEEWRATVAGYQRAASEAITRFGGEVVRYVGDGIMAFFGYPVAHDNDAERAARAGLAIVEAMVELNQQIARPNLSVRVGIDSGRLVVGSGANQAIDAFGDTANIAARVQALAEPDTVVVTGETHRLISGLFMVEERGAQMLKGLGREIKLYRVIGASGIRNRFEAAVATRTLTPFVGREDELRLLMSRWERAVEGEGQVITIIGEAGIGKSRLVQRFREQITGDTHIWLECAAAPFFQNTPFYTVAEMLRQSLDWERRLSALKASLGPARIEGEKKVMPLTASLPEVPTGADHTPSTVTPEELRKRLLATVVAWTLDVANTKPLVIATEDLHWADPSTLELIQLLVEQGETVRLLLLYTARPEFRAPWPLRAHHAQIALNRLSARNVRAMVGEVAARTALSEETVAVVVERTGGVPLFVEELTRAVLESGDAKAPGREIPATLHDSLMARLDRLGPAREIAQIGSVIGGEFRYDLLRAVYPISEADLQVSLRSLIDAELLYVRGIPPDATYQFKHALIRDAAHEALLRTRRKELHQLLAQTIDGKFPIIKETQPEVLARHWTEAGEAEPAIAAWQRAAERAVEQRAYCEAERHYRDALELLLTLPESPERDSSELGLQLALGPVLGVTAGWAAADTKAVYVRARSLSTRKGTEEALGVTWGLWLAAITRGDLHEALALAEQLREIASTLGNSLGLMQASYARGGTLHFAGDPIESNRSFRYVCEHYCENESGSSTHDYGAYARAFSAINDWLLGYPDQAQRLTDEARAFVRRRNIAFSVALVSGITAQTDGLRGDFASARASAEAGEGLSAELGLSQLRAGDRIAARWAKARMGEVEDSVEAIRTSLAEVDALGFLSLRQYFLSLLAETQALAGAVDEALATVEEAVAANPDELWYRPMTLTLRGDLQLKREPVDASQRALAERDFNDAIELSRKMSAKSPELRATTSLARLLRDTGRADEARTRLAEIYNWFTEGFDTADLKEAKALLDELGT